MKLALIDASVTEPRLSELIDDQANYAERVWYHMTKIRDAGGVNNPVGLLITRLRSAESPEIEFEIKSQFTRNLKSAAEVIQGYWDDAERRAERESESNPRLARVIRASLVDIRKAWPTAKDLARARPLAFWTKGERHSFDRKPAIDAMREAAKEELRWREANTPASA
ncbi:MAG: hypothetical protein KDA16_13385 [Phycisphaerales bacterium]|nr:hypothetical protein [Phycisphaerales bacterium]